MAVDWKWDDYQFCQFAVKHFVPSIFEQFSKEICTKSGTASCWWENSSTKFVPSLLRNDIIKKSTSLTWIWHRIRKHYSFAQSEVNFLKLSNIKRESDECYETLFQRIIAHLEDNLLTVESGLLHNGALPTSDKEMSPTLERLAVYMWLTLIDERLPAHISRAYTHDLQSKTI